MKYGGVPFSRLPPVLALAIELAVAKRTGILCPRTFAHRSKAPDGSYTSGCSVNGQEIADALREAG